VIELKFIDKFDEFSFENLFRLMFAKASENENKNFIINAEYIAKRIANGYLKILIYGDYFGYVFVDYEEQYGGDLKMYVVKDWYFLPQYKSDLSKDIVLKALSGTGGNVVFWEGI
jgi:hypothetical protein